jgi:hypothetical protein
MCEYEFNDGDVVKVARKVESRHPHGMGIGKEWMDTWANPMDKFVGKVFTIQKFNSYYGVLLYCAISDHSFWFPLLALEKVESASKNKIAEIEKKLKEIEGILKTL